MGRVCGAIRLRGGQITRPSSRIQSPWNTTDGVIFRIGGGDDDQGWPSGRPAPRAQGPQRYRDELNFAESLIASVSVTISENLKTLEFNDEILDPTSGKPVTRTLSITDADKFGDCL